MGMGVSISCPTPEKTSAEVAQVSASPDPAVAGAPGTSVAASTFFRFSSLSIDSFVNRHYFFIGTRARTPGISGRMNPVLPKGNLTHVVRPARCLATRGAKRASLSLPLRRC